MAKLKSETILAKKQLRKQQEIARLEKQIALILPLLGMIKSPMDPEYESTLELIYNDLNRRLEEARAEE